MKMPDIVWFLASTALILSGAFIVTVNSRPPGESTVQEQNVTPVHTEFLLSVLVNATSRNPFLAKIQNVSPVTKNKTKKKNRRLRLLPLKELPAQAPTAYHFLWQALTGWLYEITSAYWRFLDKLENRFLGERKLQSNVTLLHRKRRYEYEDTYDWDEDANTLDYDETGEPTFMEKVTRSWKGVALKGVFGFSSIAMCAFCCLGVCKTVCSVFCSRIKYTCREICDNIHGRKRDEIFENVKAYAEAFGVSLDPEVYQNLAQQHGVPGRPYNPFTEDPPEYK